MPYSTFNRQGPFLRAQMDIMFPPGQKREDNKTCLLVLIDTFSRYAFAEGMHDRDQNSVNQAFEKIMKKLDEQNIIPAGMVINSDMEKSFISASMNKLAESYGINLIPNTFKEDHLSLAFVDSFIGTFRNSLNKVQRYYNSPSWVDHVKNWIDLYNNQPHSAFSGPLLPEFAKEFDVSKQLAKQHKLTPSEIVHADPGSSIMRLAQALDASRIEILREKAEKEPWYLNEFKEGDTVYIPREKKSNFEKNSLQKWATDPVKITKTVGDSSPIFFYVNDNENRKYRKYQLKKAKIITRNETDQLEEARKENRKQRLMKQTEKELEIDDNVFRPYQQTDNTVSQDPNQPRRSARLNQKNPTEPPILRRSTRLKR